VTIETTGADGSTAGVLSTHGATAASHSVYTGDVGWNRMTTPRRDREPDDCIDSSTVERMVGGKPGTKAPKTPA